MDIISPTINKKSDTLSGPQTLNFYDALKELKKGRKITRLFWGSNEEFGYLSKDGYLSIYTRGANHIWQVSDGDMEAIDWYLLPEANG